LPQRYTLRKLLSYNAMYAEARPDAKNVHF
jgi:hypothetical protein